MNKQPRIGKLMIAFVVLLLSSVVNYSNTLQAKQNIGLRWKSHLISIAFSNSVIKPNLNIKPDSDVRGAIFRSLKTWENAADIKFEVNWSDKQTVSPKGSSGDGVNLITIAQTAENLLMFSRDTGEISAQTRLFFNKSGFITEADIVLNPYQQFSTDGSFGTFDLETTLTHEIGHLLGLEHSPVYGSTMFANKGKNGVFNLASFEGRTLGLADISAVRALYGTKADVERCCGIINGIVELKNYRASKNLIVWALESETGRIAGQSLIKSDGSFSLEGLPAGKYRVFCQKNLSFGSSLSAEELGLAEVKKNKIATISKTAVVLINNDPKLRVLGFNGELSEVTVPLNAGKSYMVYLGGKDLSPDSIRIGFDSPFFKIVEGSLTSQDFGTNVQAVSFIINVAGDALPGEYNVYIIQKNDEREYFLGALTIEDYINPWNNYDLSGN